jgi:hypothetical protein
MVLWLYIWNWLWNKVLYIWNDALISGMVPGLVAVYLDWCLD